MNNSAHTNPLIFTSLKWSRDKMPPPDWLPAKGATLTTGMVFRKFSLGYCIQAIWVCTTVEGMVVRQFSLG